MRALILSGFFLACIAANADDIVRVTGVDLAVQTHKWDGKTIETTLFCFYADVDEFRCGAPRGARVDFTALSPEAKRARIEKDCDTVSKMPTRACQLRLRFVYDHFDSLTQDDGSSVPVVVAKDNSGEIVGP